MYKSDSTVLNHNPRIPFPVAFYFGPEKITVRTFRSAQNDRGVALGAEAAERILLAHMAPFAGPDDAARSVIFDGAGIAAGQSGKRFALQDALTVTRDPEMLGKGVVSDRCDLVWLVSREGHLDVPHSRTVRLLPDRRSRAAIYALEKNKLNLLTVVTEYADTRWEDALVVIKANPEQGFRIDFEGKDPVVPQLLALPQVPPFYTPKGYPRFGSLVLEGPGEIAAGGSATLTVRAVRHNSRETDKSQSEVHVETVSGYAPHSRVRLRDGVASFKVMALGLDAGESMRVKVGWRFFPGLAEMTLGVVAPG